MHDLQLGAALRTEGPVRQDTLALALVTTSRGNSAEWVAGSAGISTPALGNRPRRGDILESVP